MEILLLFISTTAINATVPEYWLIKNAKSQRMHLEILYPEVAYVFSLKLIWFLFVDLYTNRGLSQMDTLVFCMVMEMVL